MTVLPRSMYAIAVKHKIKQKKKTKQNNNKYLRNLYYEIIKKNYLITLTNCIAF